MKNSISFDKYDRQEDILRKFKEQAAANADKNKGILIPAPSSTPPTLIRLRLTRGKTTPVIDKKAKL